MRKKGGKASATLMERAVASVALLAGRFTRRVRAERANVARVLGVGAEMRLAELALQQVDEARHAEQRLR